MLAKVYDAFDCLFENAPFMREMAKRSGLEANAWAVTHAGGTTNLVVVYEDYTMNNLPAGPEDSEAKCVLLQVLDHGKRMIRYTHTNAMSVVAKLAAAGVQKQAWCSLDHMVARADAGAKTITGPGCFVKAVGLITGVEPLAAACMMTKATSVVATCKEHEIALLDGCRMYTDPAWDNPWLIVVQNNHCYHVTRSIDTTRYTVVSIDEWSKPLDGEIDRMAATGKKLVEVVRKMSELEDTAPTVRAERTLCVLEAVEYNMRAELVILSKYKRIYADLTPERLLSFENVYIYDRSAQAFVAEHPEGTMSAAWDGTAFLDINYDSDSKLYTMSSAARFVVMSDEIEFLRASKMVDRYDTWLPWLSTYEYETIGVTLVDGVPGCGKTHEILTRHRVGADLVCTTTKAAQLEYVLAMKGTRYPHMYRTYDSVLLNGSVPSRRMFADEGLMVHAGELLMAAVIAGASEVFIMGDSKQIPFISRVAGVTVRHEKLQTLRREERNVTYRLPRNIIPVLLRFYPRLETKSTLEGSSSVNKISAAPDLSDVYEQIITFTQYEKGLVKQMNATRVNTIHEVQGGTFRKVALVRTHVQQRRIYESEPHIIVALSRHKEVFDYYTVDDNDTVSKILKREAVEVESSAESARQQREAAAVVGGTVPTRVWYETQLRLTTRACSEFADFIMRCAGLRLGASRPVLMSKYHVPSPELEGVDLGTEVSLVQCVLDAIYEPVDSQALERMEHEDVLPFPKGMQVDYPKLLAHKESQPEGCSPKLRTVQPVRLNATLVRTLNAIQKRNMDPPMIALPLHEEAVEAIVDCFFRTYVDQERMVTTMGQVDYDDKEYLADWLASRTGAEYSAMAGKEFEMPRMDKYNSHLKQDAKPPLGGTHNVVAVAGQTITAHDIRVTARFSGAMKAFTEALKGSLKDKWCINDGLTTEELSAFMNQHLHDQAKIVPQEVDFSKFDKSQNELSLRVVCAVLKRFGMPEPVVKEWNECHKVNTLQFNAMGLSIKTRFQRRSGDVLTFMGNTILTMVALAYTHDYERAVCGVFGGDDSLVFLDPKEPIVDHSKTLADVFNLDAKLVYMPEAIYFASRFLIQFNGTWWFVPDPLKAVVRLGRNDLYCKEHVELYHASFADNLKYYRNPEVRIAATEAAYKRYKSTMHGNPDNIDVIGEFINDLTLSKGRFLNLYYAESRVWNRKLPVSLTTKEERVTIESILYEF